MKALWGAISLAAVVTVGLAVLIYTRKDPWGPPEAGAGAQADAVIARWSAQNVPMNKRALTVVVYDRSASGTPVDPPDESAVLAKRSPLDRLLGNPPPDPATADFIDTLRKESGVVLVRYDPRAAGDAASQGVKEAIVKAHDAGAEINVVTAGASVAPAVKAISELEGTTRQGVAVGVNKLVALGIERPRLKLIHSYFNSDPRPRNVLEWANFYREPGAVPPKTYLDVSTRGGAPVQFSGGLAASVSADPARGVAQLLADVRPIVAAAKAARPPDEPAGERPFRNLEGQTSFKTFKSESAAMPKRPAAPTSDSMSMIKAPEEETGKVTAKATPGDCGQGFHPFVTDMDWCCPDKAPQRFTVKSTPERV
ncbi:MAG: hypothetical protein HY925_14180, partial [Elusimicrobia bacterium]|nr:hypothetical protein [Elusimicrobiota bacterium]